jgi:hypothetical protein
MNSHTDNITIGRNVTLTYQILNAISKRRVRDGIRQARWTKLKKIFTLRKNEN